MVHSQPPPSIDDQKKSIEDQKKSIEDQKKVAFYAAAVTAWFATSLEHDKSLLTLSAAGIGLHLTLLTTVGIRSTEALVLYIFAIICFAASLLIVLGMLDRNKKYIERIVRSEDITKTDISLARMDASAKFIFGLGVFCTAIVGISAAIFSYSDKDRPMAEKQKPTPSVPIFDSFNGAAKLQPTKSLLKESFSGAASLQPAASQPAAQATTAQPQAPTPAAQAQTPTQSPPPAATK